MLPRSKKREADDVFPEDGVEVDEEADQDEDGQAEHPGLRLLAAIPGPVIAAATFVPTFLVIFFGMSYVLGGALQTSVPAPPAAALMSDGTQGTPPPISESLRDPFVAPRLIDPPSGKPGDPGDVARPTDPREPFRAPGMADRPTPAIESTGPSLPPAQARAAIIPAPESRAGRPAEPPRQPQAAVLNTTPERKPGREWAPAAAFTDREAASRLASSIQQQGYPVEIRQESSSSRPWVVWIGAQPRAGERRR